METNSVADSVGLAEVNLTQLDRKLPYWRETAPNDAHGRSGLYKVTDFGTNWKPVYAASY